jgi:hypothetical protein
MSIYTVWSLIVRVLRRRKSAAPTSVDQTPQTVRNTDGWRREQRINEANVNAAATEITDRSLRSISERNCDLCSERLDGRDALIAHYLQKHEIPAGVRGGGTGGIECPECHYEYELVADEVLHFVATHRV